MSVDPHKMAAAILRHRAEELRKLKGEDAFKPFTIRPTHGWALVSQGLVNLVADQLDELARDLVSGQAG